MMKNRFLANGKGFKSALQITDPRQTDHIKYENYSVILYATCVSFSLQMI